MPASSLGLSVAAVALLLLGSPVAEARAIASRPPAARETVRQLSAAPARAELQSQPSPSAQKPTDGFEPISEIPPEDRMPAAPMVVAAYAFVMLAFFAYVLSLARRLGAVNQEISRLESELKRSGRT